MSNAITADSFALVGRSARRRLLFPFGQLLAIAKGLFDRRRHAENLIVSRYAGCSWGDMTERRLNDDLANSNWSHFC